MTSLSRPFTIAAGHAFDAAEAGTRDFEHDGDDRELDADAEETQQPDQELSLELARSRQTPETQASVEAQLQSRVLIPETRS